MGTVTTWMTYIISHPFNEAQLWDAFQQLDRELDDLYDPANIPFTPSSTFYSGGVNSVGTALEELGNYLDTSGYVSTMVHIPSPNGDPLIDTTCYGRWIMTRAGYCGEGDFRVETAPSTGDCTLGVYVDGVLRASVVIPNGENEAITSFDLSAVAFSDRSVLEVKCVTANLAGDLSGYIKI